MHAFGFGDGGTGKRVIFGCGVTFRQGVLDDLVDDDAILRVHANQAAARAGRRHRAKDRRVVYQKNSGISHEHLEAGHAFIHDGVHLFDLFVFECSCDQMKAVIDRALAFGFFVPVVDALKQRFAFVLHGEIDDRGCTAVRRRDCAGSEIIRRSRAAEWQFHMRVRIDATGDDVFAARIDLDGRGLARLAHVRQPGRERLREADLDQAVEVRHTAGEAVDDLTFVERLP